MLWLLVCVCLFQLPMPKSKFIDSARERLINYTKVATRDFKTNQESTQQLSYNNNQQVCHELGKFVTEFNINPLQLQQLKRQIAPTKGTNRQQIRQEIKSIKQVAANNRKFSVWSKKLGIKSTTMELDSIASGENNSRIGDNESVDMCNNENNGYYANNSMNASNSTSSNSTSSNTRAPYITDDDDDDFNLMDDDNDNKREKVKDPTWGRADDGVSNEENDESEAEDDDIDITLHGINDINQNDESEANNNDDLEKDEKVENDNDEVEIDSNDDLEKDEKVENNNDDLENDSNDEVEIDDENQINKEVIDLASSTDECKDWNTQQIEWYVRNKMKQSKMLKEWQNKDDLHKDVCCLW